MSDGKFPHFLNLVGASLNFGLVTIPLVLFANMPNKRDECFMCWQLTS